MKTTSLLLLMLFGSAVLAVNGASANKATPSLAIDCPLGCTLEFSGLDPASKYFFVGVSSTGDTTRGGVIPNADGTYIQYDGLSAGTWEFTLTEEHRNGKLAQKPVIDQFFDIP